VTPRLDVARSQVIDRTESGHSTRLFEQQDILLKDTLTPTSLNELLTRYWAVKRSLANLLLVKVIVFFSLA